MTTEWRIARIKHAEIVNRNVSYSSDKKKRAPPFLSRFLTYLFFLKFAPFIFRLFQIFKNKTKKIYFNEIKYFPCILAKTPVAKMSAHMFNK